MRRGRYVELRRPRPVLVDVAAPHPGRYYVALVDALLRCSLPAAGRLGPLRAAVARHGLARAPLRAALSLTPARDRPELDQLRRDLVAGWAALAQASDRLPADPPELAMLSLRRSLGRLVFVFGDAPNPLLVCKIPDGDDGRVDDEAAVLEKVRGLGLAPRYLEEVAGARVQEALPGHPMPLQPLASDSAAVAAWGGPLTDAAALLHGLSKATYRAEGVDIDFSGAARSLLTTQAATRVTAALERLRHVNASVLCHGDASPQNLMVTSGGVSGLVDWELARRGHPGADVLNLVHSVFEQRLGLAHWTSAEVLAAFSVAWDTSPLFVEGRRAAREAIEAVGLTGDIAADVEIAHFARRLHRRAARPAHYVGGVRMAAGMVERVCAS